jgi:hypothetical protein
LIEASWQALVDSLDFKLYKDGKRAASTPDPAVHQARRTARGGEA